MTENDLRQNAREPALAAGAIVPARSAGERNLPAWLPLTILALALLVTVGVRLRLLAIPLERDEGEYAYAGQLILEGIPPYQLAYNMKMPGTYLAYAGIMALFGQTAAGIHLGLLIVHLATVAMLFLIARRLLDPSGAAIATAAFTLMILSPAYLGLAAHATHFVLLPALLGVRGLLGLENEERRERYFGTGCLFGVAFLLKQPGMFFGIFAGLWLAWTSLAGKRASRHALTCLAAYAAGCALPFFAVCIWLEMAGVFTPFWFWTIVYAREYAGINGLDAGLRALVPVFKDIVHTAPLLWVAAGLGLGGLFLAPHPRQTRRFLGGFLLCSGLAVCPGWYFRPHYFILLAPAVALLAGLAVSWGGRSLRRRGAGPLLSGLPFLLAVAACAQSLYADRLVFFSQSPEEACQTEFGPTPFPQSPAIARYIEEHTRADEPVMVIGSEPEVYFYAHRHSSSGHIYMYPLMEAQPFAEKMQEHLIREVEQHPPAFLVLVAVPQSWDVGPTSSHRLIDWLGGYLNQGMQLVGLIQYSQDQTIESVWGPGAVTALMTSDYFVAVLQRVKTSAEAERACLAARNHELLHHFNLYTAPRNNLGVALAREGRLDEAIGWFREALRLDPEYADAHNNLGMALALKGEVAAAIPEFREALRLRPDYADAKINLTRALARAAGATALAPGPGQP